MKKLILSIILITSFQLIIAQNQEKDYGQIQGNFEINMQSYNTDSIIGAFEVPEKVRANTYANFIYTKGKFTAGVRYEAYLNTLLGYDSRYNGQGIAHRYATYKGDDIEITAGNFYEQFGNGLVLRTYEDKTLGYDNSIDGMRIKYSPIEGIQLTGLIGKQRKYFDLGQGIVRGIDAEISINDAIKKLADKKTRVLLGGSFVSKYQQNVDPTYYFPENVGAFSGRLNINRGGFNIASEYAYKINDPSYDNAYIFKDGNALLINTSYSKKGIGVLLGIMRLDNMSFRSDRSATINDLHINYLPAIAKTHAYAFAAMYPFATQPSGQIGMNAEIFYNIKRKSALGGKYGMNISINYSQVNSIDKQKITIDPTAEYPNLDGYTSDYFKIGDELFFRDFNIEIHKKVSKKYKFALTYMHEDYNKDVIQGLSDFGIIKAEIGILDMTYKFSSKKALRSETEFLYTEDDNGSWIMQMFEYTYAPHWFVAASDQYNYGNVNEDYRVHYYNVAAGYTKDASRFQLSYGKIREGIMCVGGVCRNVPASNGLSLTITTTF